MLADTNYYVELMPNDVYIGLANAVFGWDVKQWQYGCFRGMNCAGFADYPMAVLFSAQPVDCKDRSRVTRGMNGQPLMPGQPLAAVGFYSEQLAVVVGRAPSRVVRVRGIHSMVSQGASKLLTLLCRLLFSGDARQQLTQLCPHDAWDDVVIEAVMPYAPFPEMKHVMRWNLGALPSGDRDRNLCLVNPAVLSGLEF